MSLFHGYDLYPWIEPQISNLLAGDLNLCVGRPSVKTISSSSLTRRDHKILNDVFTISIPYAGSTLHWQILFNGSDPEDLPDFLIPDYSGFDPDYEDIPHLVNWDHRDPDALLNIVRDLLGLYKKHTLKLVSKENSNFASDVAELISAKNYDPVDAILLKPVADDYSPSSSRPVISVLVQIKLDTSQVPDICFKDAPPEDPTFLHPVVQIHCSDSGKIVPQLYVPRGWSSGRNSMKLPAYSRQTTVLLEYLQSVDKHLSDLLLVIREGHTKRREYIAAFLCLFSDNIVEYDAEEFRTITLLFSHEDFYFLVHVTLSRLFPQEQPELIFQSVYHFTKNGTLYQVPHSSYPYSPRWSGNEMVKRTRTYILDRIESFKAGCVKHGVV